MKSQIHQLLFVFLSCLASQSLFSCGYFVEPERYQVTFFDAHLGTDATDNYCYVHGKASDTDSRKANLQEWKTYFNNAVPVKAIETAIYTLEESDWEAVLNTVKNGTPLPASLRQNACLRYLTDRKALETVQYLYYAKSCEPYVYAHSYWEEPEQDEAAMSVLMALGKQTATTVKSDFLKMRYLYQAARLAHYSGQYETCIAIFEQEIEPLKHKEGLDKLTEQSIIYAWSMLLYAGAQKRLENYASSLYHFGKVIAQNCDKKALAIQNFWLPKEATWKATIDLAENETEMGNLWFLYGMKTQNLSTAPLEAMYKADAKSKNLSALLVKEMGKVEKYLVSPNVTQQVEIDTDASIFTPETEAGTLQEVWWSIRNAFGNMWGWLRSWFIDSTPPTTEFAALEETIVVPDLSYINELKTFAINAFNGEKPLHNPALWQVTIAYLAYLEGNYQQAFQFLDAIKSKDTAIQQQAKLVRALSKLGNEKHIDTNLEMEFHDVLKNLKQPEYSYNNYSIFARTMTLLAHQYLQQDQVGKAILCMEKGKENHAANALMDFYAQQDDLDAFKLLAAKPNKNGFETFLFKDSRFTKSLILDQKATKWMRAGEYEKALATYQEIPANYWAHTEEASDWWGDDNYRNFKCSFDPNVLSYEPIETTCNKLTFAKKIVELEQKAQTDASNAANYYFQIGNGFFNTPFWGYMGRVWDGSLVNTFNMYYDYEPGLYPLNVGGGVAQKLYNREKLFKERYGVRKQAADYYQKVIDLTKNDHKELGAQAAYLAIYSLKSPHASFQEGETGDQYAAIFRDIYSQTQFYKQIIEECSAFQ